MSIIKEYLISLTPISKFFFGSSYSLGDSFYAESLKFPQPTTVLGWLRNTILLQNGIVLKDKKNFPDIENAEAKELTGNSKIENLCDLNTNFGILEKVSPVFILKQRDSNIEDILFHVPNDVINENNFLEKYSYKKNTDSISSYSGRRLEYAILSEKKSKSFLADYLGGKEFWEAYLENKKDLPYNLEYTEDKVFLSHTSVGITKGKKEGAFYTKIEYSFKKSFSFGVFVWAKEDRRKLKDDVLKEGVTILGGEQSAFLLKIYEVNDELKRHHPLVCRLFTKSCEISEVLKNSNAGDKLVSLSPIFLKDSEYDTLINSFEHFVVEDIHSTRTVNRRNGHIKSEAMLMIPAFSVFYVGNNRQDLSESCKLPYKIGYNYAIKI